MVQRGGAAFPSRQRPTLPRHLEEALHRAIRTQALNDPEVRPNDHFITYLNLLYG